ncbi:hypothetical protein K8Z61_09030 [Nocardioides sp. TRM66260-LWL]|uniref:hypothetical protein n=1 Tax=Nocardioides sp. TRM66260-LWL TaxID=2874478 RepID=UPI001CC709A8|nr:hypothetical protein [Nocardioides sp. TRM66260-LWL]MBZ5734641.1 hypothetical protein [Nocardioides sp. TRM66260-LWL]
MSPFGRRDDAAQQVEEPERPGMLDDPGIPEEVQRMVRARGTAARPHPHLVRNRGAHPLLLLAAMPEALVHVEFVPPSGGSRVADYSVDFVPWTMLESVRVNGPTIRFAWGGKAVVTEMTSHVEALQMARSFLGQSRDPS